MRSSCSACTTRVPRPPRRCGGADRGSAGGTIGCAGRLPAPPSRYAAGGRACRRRGAARRAAAGVRRVRLDVRAVQPFDEPSVTGGPSAARLPAGQPSRRRSLFRLSGARRPVPRRPSPRRLVGLEAAPGPRVRGVDAPSPDAGRRDAGLSFAREALEVACLGGRELPGVVNGQRDHVRPGRRPRNSRRPPRRRKRVDRREPGRPAPRRGRSARRRRRRCVVVQPPRADEPARL